MIANILIAIGFFGMGTFFGSLWMTNMTLKAYINRPTEVIDLFEKYKKRWEALNGVQN